MFAVCVTFHIREGQTDGFLPHMLEQASNSLALEPECHQFDVCLSEDRQSVFLYELYTDKAAFEAHLQSAHFHAFDRAVADMLLSKDVEVYQKLEAAP